MTSKNLLSETRKEIILSLAANRMRVTEVALELSLHRNTIIYNIGRIHEITGKNPLDFYDLIELVCMVKKKN